MKLITVLLFCLVSAPAFAQVARPTGLSPSDTIPLFRVTVVGRTTAAINYRPRSGKTKVDLAGTALLPRAYGYVEVAGEKGHMEIDAHLKRMGPATRFGSEYLTYVLWAITPEGRATNLGEIQFDDDDLRVQVTTEFQAFALIVTAEPYFAVTQPSDVVVMENVVRDDTKGKVETVQANYELLKRGSYLMNQSANFKAKPVEPGAPLDLAEARNAVELSRLAGADRYAPEPFAKAENLLADAEAARAKHKRSNEVMMPARQAAQTAEDARLIALQRQEDELQTQQRVAGARRELDAEARTLDAEARASSLESERADAERTRRRQAELDTQNAAAGRAAAERERLESERSRQEALTAQSDAEQARVAAEAASRAANDQAEQARQQTLQARADAEQARAAAETDRRAANDQAEQAREQTQQARADAEQARAAAEAARRAANDQAEQSREQTQQALAQAEQEKSAMRGRLREQLSVVLETRETARGLIVNVSDVLFDSGSATLKPGAREKLARVAGILATHSDLKIEIEGHTDSVGSNDYNQALSQRRAQSVRGYLVQQKIPPAAVVAAGFGESYPVAGNETAAGRQQNRRVELVVSGESIGRTSAGGAN